MFAASINSLFSEKISLVEGDFSPHVELFDHCLLYTSDAADEL